MQISQPAGPGTTDSGPKPRRWLRTVALLAGFALILILGLPMVISTRQGARRAARPAEPPPAGTAPEQEAAAPPAQPAAARPAESEQARQARALLARGRAQYQRGDYEAAIADFQQALAADPGNREAKAALRRAQVAKEVAAMGVLGALGSSSSGGSLGDVFGSGSGSTGESRAQEEAARRQAEEMRRLEEFRQREQAETEGAKREERVEPEMAGGGSAPPAQPAAQPPVVYEKKTEVSFPDATIEGDLAKPPAASSTLERFPTVESPDAVAPGQEFAVQVSLTEEQITPEARVQQGATTAEGKVVLNLPAAPEQQQWKIDVALSAPGLDFARGSNMGSIVLPRQGDSTVAIFYLRARPIATTEKSVHLMATLWYQGGYLARIERDLVVRNPQAVAANKEAAPGAATRAEAKEAAAPASPQQRRAALDLGFVPPDLTVVLLANPGDNTDTLILESPHLQPAQYTVPRAPGLREWLAAQYRQIAARSSMASVGDAQEAAAERRSTGAFLRGFGRQLYLQFAPAPFRDAFWKLEDKLGPSFRTIQIFTDDPTLPWELMRPVRADGSGERDFLGTEFSVARWHVTQDAAQLERPPQTEPLEKVVVIAPQYQGERALPAQSAELAALQKFPGYSPVEGDMEALRALFQDLPRGLVHFAGHGAVAQQPGSPQFAILLEDGPLDLMTWRGLAPLRQKHHPVFFFNACEVGQSQKVANFVDGWAPAVLRAGASGYIGALWPVNDRVAALFAARFYQTMERDLAGGRAPVSEVLTQTRRQVFRETGDPTALAYVFYGDPNLALARVR